MPMIPNTTAEPPHDPDWPPANWPRLKAYSLPGPLRRLNGYGHWVVICPFCGTFHRHGPAEGSREPHCHREATPAYVLKYAGVLPEPLWDQFRQYVTGEEGNRAARRGALDAATGG